MWNIINEINKWARFILNLLLAFNLGFMVLLQFFPNPETLEVIKSVTLYILAIIVLDLAKDNIDR